MTRDHRETRRRRRSARKDRLIQTRVHEDLEQTLKREAARRRLTVSHLIRNTLEDTFNLVEDVTADVEQIVSGSVELAAAVGRDARRLADLVRGRTPGPDASEGDEREDEQDTGSSLKPGAPEDDGAAAERPTTASEPASPSTETEQADPLSHVYGWNRVIANREARCVSCTAEIVRGDDALVGLSDDPSKPRAWLCADCGEELG